MAVKQNLSQVGVQGLSPNAFVDCNYIHIMLHKKKHFMI